MVNEEREQAIRQVAGEVARHLTWLRDAGVREVPVPVARPAVAAQPALVAATAHVAEAGRPVDSRVAPTPPIGPGGGAGEKGVGSPELTAVRADLGDCGRCKLAGGRTTLVFGVGAPRAELMFVGEGPGADEDLQGEPFVGKAGQLLTKMIEAMGYRRDQVYIANVVKCRPPGNRNPEPDEIVACEPFLMRQIDAVRPKVIVALGKFAAHTLLRSAIPITRLRGTWGEYRGVKLMPTFHPAYLLRSPHEKAKAWEDLKQVVAALGRQLPAPGGRQG
jgi:uracil-DNA glycosylase family 4